MPSARDRNLRTALILSAAFVALGVASQLPIAWRPPYLVTVVVGVLIGLVLHYQLASYELVDGEATLPQAQMRGGGNRPDQ